MKTTSIAQGDKGPLAPWGFLALLVAFAVALSFGIWMRESVRLDEAQSVWQTSRDLPGVITIIARDVHAPLYFVALHYWEVLFGTSEVAIRSFSLLFFALSIPAMFFLADVAYGRRAAYFTALITSFSPFLNWYGSEARMYSLLLFVAILSHLFFVMLWKRPTRLAWAGYSVATFLGIFTHFFFYFVLAVQAVTYLSRKDLFPPGVFKHFLKIMLVVGLSGIAWFGYRAAVGLGTTDPTLSPPSTVDLSNIFSNFFIGFQTDALNTFYLSLWPVLVLISFTFLARRKWADPETKYFVMSTFVPIALAFVVSVTVRPIFLSRYLIICLPTLYLIVAHFVFSYRRAVSHAIATGIVCMMVLMLAVQAREPASPVKEDYRSAARYIAENARPRDLVVVSAPFITYPVEYYYDGVARIETFPKWDRFSREVSWPPYSDDLLAQSAEGWKQVYERVYVLLGYDQGYQEDVRLYMDQHFERIEAKTFSPGLELYVYKLRYL